MASSSVLRIELAPDDFTPARISSTWPPKHRRQRAYTDSTLLSAHLDPVPQRDEGHTLHPCAQGHGAAGSSGYMSSCSNLHSPRVIVTRPHPSHLHGPLPFHSQREHEREELLSNRREHSNSGYYHHRLYEDSLRNGVYSRLDHSPADTLTRRTPQHHWTPPTSLPVDHVMPRPRHVHQHSLDMDQFNSHLTPLHSECGGKKRHGPPKTPLGLLLKRLEGLDGQVKRWIIKADQHLKWEEFDKAIPFLEGTIVQTQAYPNIQFVLWELLGNAQLAAGMTKKASVCYLHHLAYSRAQADFRSMTRAECNLGITYMQLGLLKLAGRSFLQYLRNSRSLQDECGIETACSNLGLLSKTLALKNYREAMERGEAEVALTTLTSCLRRAIIFFKQHLEVVIAHGNIEKQGRAYGNIGSCYELLKDYPEAVFYHQKRLEVARAMGDMYSELCTLCNLGNCCRAKGSLDQALDYYQMNLEMAQSLGDNKMEELIQNNLGVTYELLNQLDKAITCYTLYLSMVVRTGELKKQTKGFSTLARLYLESGQTTKAHEYYVNLVDVFQKLGDHTSLTAARLQLKSIGQLMKQEKRKKKRGSHTSSKQGRLRAHTVSRASNFRCEMPGNTLQGLTCRPQAMQDKVGTWSTGKRPRPLLNTVPPPRHIVEDFAPDPILVMADISPSWAGPVGLCRGDVNSSSYPLQPTSLGSHGRSCDQSLHHGHTHSRYMGNSLESNISSCSSGSYDHIPPLAHSNHHAHLPHPTHCHTHPSEVLYDYRGRLDYELVDPPDISSTGRSTALPPLSYTSSISLSVDQETLERGCGNSEDELTDEEDHMKELKKAGLVLARAGLELAGYEGALELGIEEGADKEWEQWQQINEDEQGAKFGSLMSVAGRRSRNKRKQPFKRRLHTTISAPNL